MKALRGFFRCIGLIGFIAFAATGRAQDAASNSMKIDDASGKSGNTIPDAEKIDELIQNNNLRALSGSTSKWSMASAWNYNGGTVKTPFAEDRPDISQASATTAKADLDGNVSAKYNIDVKNSLMAGVGLRWIAPLAKNGPHDYDGTTFDVQNPYLQYQYLYNWKVQSVLQAQVMQWTQADSTALGYQTQYNVDQENMYEIGKSGFSIGASIWGEFTTFNKTGSYLAADDPNHLDDVRSAQNDWQFGLVPELEYQLTEKLNLRTLVSLFVFEHYRNAASNTFVHDKVFQSIGIGWSVTRDIFLYPNVQFLPNQVASNLTNVGVSATVNVF